MSNLNGGACALSTAWAGKRAVRTQFGALPWRRRKGGIQVCLVTTRGPGRGRGRWILPKGWPMPGRTPAEVAAREAFEEAGLIGETGAECAGIYTYVKGGGLPCVVALFPLEVTKARKSWPEARARERRWTSPRKAAALVEAAELAQILRAFDPG